MLPFPICAFDIIVVSIALIDRRKGITMATILDGKETAARIEQRLAEQVEVLWEERGVRPGLAAVLVGEHPASATYVRMKRKRSTKIGLHFELHKFATTVTKDELRETLGELNRSEKVHGVLVQLPLPEHLDAHEVIDWIAPEKDVDGLTTLNQGLLYRGKPCLAPCTPKGMIRLLDEYGIATEGKNAVVVGRSELVGRPLAVMLASRSRNATVTIAHTRTRNLRQVTKRAEIVAVAIGRAQMLDATYFADGVVVIDAGTNAVPSKESKTGRRLVGDVDFASVSEIASYITPVPGGVGPMTVCMLLENTVEAARSVSSGG